MARFPPILQPKWKLYRRHEERLRSAPDPRAAARRFDHGLRASKRASTFRTACFVGLYFSLILAGAGFLLDYVNFVPHLGALLRLLQAVASTFTVAFFIGAFVANRYLAYLEVDLLFYAMERQAKPTVASTASKRASKR